MIALTKKGVIGLLDWVIEIPKSVPILIVSFAAVIGAIYLPWVAMPSLDYAAVNAGGGLELGVNGCWLEILLRCVFASLMPVVVIAWGKGRRLIVETLLWSMMVVLLLFPTVLLISDPQFQLESERLDSSLAYVVEQMDSLHAMQQGDWRVWQEFISGSPKADTEVPQVIPWTTELLSLPNFQLVLSGILGYSDSFFAFSTRGWVFGILGTTFALLALYISESSRGEDPSSSIDCPSRLLFRKGLKKFFSLYFFGLFITQIPSAVAEHLVDRGDYFSSIGSPQRALNYYQKAIEFKPVYAYNSLFLVKRGHLFDQLGDDDNVEFRLYKALSFLMRADMPEAHYWAEQAERLSPTSKSLIYLKSGLFNLLAMQRFNEGEYSRATELWRRSLMLDPLNASAWYGLSLAALQLKKFEDASHHSEQIYNLQKYLGFKPLVVPAQIHLYRSWHLFSKNQIAAAHDAYRLSKLPESW